MTEHAPFARQEPPRFALLRRLIRQRGRSAACVELNNLLAARALRGITQADVDAICRRHRVDLRRDLGTTAERLYRAYLAHCLTDRHLGNDELCDLAHLQRVLGVNDRTADAIHDHVARSTYEESVADALEDGRIDADEREFLHRLQRHLELPDRVAAKIVETKQRARWESAPGGLAAPPDA